MVSDDESEDELLLVFMQVLQMQMQMQSAGLGGGYPCRGRSQQAAYNLSGTIVDPRLDSSGRPLYPVAQVGVPSILERPSSPATLEDQRESKKSRSENIEQNNVTVHGESTDMEVDMSDSVVGDRVQGQKGGGSDLRQGGTDIGRVSYANMVTQGINKSGRRLEEDDLS
ncbi:hypothetical protein V6N12_057091 [Hibiscus sabdariffa]|uniref:Uncharacterized protein n=1 Tax=Hibiscus sabdariffa TaxID=183260 RepID=A0ABR2DD05_9ROSI